MIKNKSGAAVLGFLTVAVIVVLAVLIGTAWITISAILDAPSETERALYDYCITSIDAALVAEEVSEERCQEWADAQGAQAEECYNRNIGFYECGLELPFYVQDSTGMD